MKSGSVRPRVRKALTVATAFAGAAAGATAFVPTAAHAVTGGWQIKITLGARVSKASVCGTDAKGVFVCEQASNHTGMTRNSVPFTVNGVMKTFPGPQFLDLAYSGVTVPFTQFDCPIAAGSGTMLWSATAKGHNC